MNRAASSRLGRAIARLLIAGLLANGAAMPMLARSAGAPAGHHHSDSSTPRQPQGHHLADCCAFCSVHCVTHLRPQGCEYPRQTALLRPAPPEWRLPAGPGLAPLRHRQPLSQGPPPLLG